METIFQLEILRYYNIGRRRVYPKRTYTQGYVNYTSLAEVEGIIPALAMKYDDVCCFIIREIPFGREYWRDAGITERVYLKTGKLHSTSCVSSIDNKERFIGRDPKEILFKRGDLVAVLNYPLEKIELATVIAPPPTKKDVEKKMKEHPDLRLDYSDDSYIVIYGNHDLNKLSEVEYMRGHAHYPTNLLFDPKDI